MKQRFITLKRYYMYLLPVFLFLLVTLTARAEETDGVCEAVYHVHTGTAQEGGGCYTVPVYHVHSGEPSSAGGCYTSPVLHSHTEACYGYAEKPVTVHRENQGEWDDFQHSEYEWCSHCETSCEEQYYTGVSYRISVQDGSVPDFSAAGSYHFCANCNYTCFRFSYEGKTREIYGESASNAASAIGTVLSVYCPVCGMDETTAERYEPGCGRTPESVDSWQTGCGMDETTEVARFCLKQADTEWSRQKTLEASCLVLKDCGLPEPVFFWNGHRDTTGTQFTAEHNGDYTCGLMLGENTDAAAHRLSLQVSHIDREAPEIVLSVSEGWGREAVVTARARDGQSGVAGFSWDGGRTWSDQDRCEATVNKAVTVQVRDGAGNVADAEISVKNVDRQAPEVSLTWEPEDWTCSGAELCVQADDPPSDGGSGSGLAEEAYSYDGGLSWTGENRLRAGRNGSYAVVVRDRAGNRTEKKLTLDRIDQEGPVVKLTAAPDPWREGKAVIRIEAADAGAGLADSPFCWKGGSWSTKTEKEVWESGIYELTAADRLGNTTKASIQLTKEPETEKEAPEDKVPPEEPEKKTEPEEQKPEEKTETEEQKPEEQEPEEKTEPEEQEPEKKTETVEQEPEEKTKPEGQEPEEKTETKETEPEEKTESEEGEATEEPERQPAPAAEVPLPGPEPATKTGPAAVEIPAEAGAEETGEKEPEEEITEEKKLRPLLQEAPERVRRTSREGKEKTEREKLPAPVFWTLAVLTGLLLLAGLFWLLMLLLRGIRVYNYEGEGKFAYLGTEFLEKKEDCWQLSLRREWYEACDTVRFRLKCSALFIKLHEGEEVLVRLPEGEISVEAGRQMEFSL